MQVTRFRVKNYKSIIDSGDCFLSNKVTILAGKNESGKSSLLEALEDFNADRPIREKSIPIQDESLKPEITVWLLLSPDEINTILEVVGVGKATGNSEGEIRVTKTFPHEFSVDPTSCLQLNVTAIDDLAAISHAFDALDAQPDVRTIAQSIGHPIPSQSGADRAGQLKAMQQWQAKLPQLINSWAPHLHEPLQDAVQGVVSALQRAVGAKDAVTNLASEIVARMPNFILFSSFDDVFPNRVALSELATNKWILDLQKISDLSIEKIQGTNERVKVTHNDQLNLALNADFGKYWTQDASKLRIQFDNEKLQFWVHENGRFYEPEIRSQGRRWHLAFYIRVSARARDDTKNVVLIDEPGLYLHANAQRDILMNLEEASKRMQVVFSTHSPYLMEQDKFDRIRLVQKSESHGTKVENKVHAVSDVETLTPVLTAIGLELNRGIVATDRLNNAIVEGPSDFYYLTAMKKLLKREINFVFGGGATNMPKVGTILHGWGCRVIYLYDNDTGYKNAKRSIEKNWPTIDESSIDVLPTGDAIEDLFTKQDFAQYVLQIEPYAIAGKNSVHMKGRDKVLPSRRFLQLCEGDTMPNLSAETIAKWGSVFDSLHSKLLEPKPVT